MQEMTSDATTARCDLRWVKSSLSFANGESVEVARLPDGRVGVRDSKDPGGPVLRFTPAEWARSWAVCTTASSPSCWPADPPRSKATGR
jgi:hypothetical protein